MADIQGVINELKEVKKAVKESSSESATEQVKAAEAASEAQQQENEKIGIFEAIRDSLDGIAKAPKGIGKDKSAFGMLSFAGILRGIGITGLVTSLVSTIGAGLTTAFTTLGSSFVGTILKQLALKIPVIAIISALALAIKDGIMGWTMSEDWGVSNISGFLGGFFGGTGSGIKNAFTNAGKFALLGAGVGALFGGPVGALAGGLVGAAIGGILGFIGGEKIAKSFDGIGAFFQRQFDTFIVQPIKAVWDVIAPDWVKSIDFKWQDFLPPGLSKLFAGE